MKRDKKHNVILHIDTSSNTEAVVRLDGEGISDTYIKKLDRNRAQVVLPMIEELLTRNHIQPEDLSMLKVNCGPGSFTGLRVGVSIANSLASYLQIPINDLPLGELADPIYS